MTAEPGDRPLAPFGRRRCEVTENPELGGYRMFALTDEAGPRPAAGQFYMVGGERWEGPDGRPFLPRALSVARATPARGGVRLDFLIDGVGPGTERLCRLRAGDSVWLAGPFGRPFSGPRELNPAAAGAILVGGGIGIAPLAILRRSLAASGVPTRSLIGFRDRRHSGGVDELFGCEEVRLASEDGHAGHRGYVTDLLTMMLEGGDDPGGAVVYACGPPPMLEAVRAICERGGVPAELAMESPMACGYGACFGCAVPRRDGGYMRLCIDGPVVAAGEIASALVGEQSWPA